MSEPVRPTQSRQNSLASLSQGLLRGAAGMNQVRHTLEIRHQAAPSFAPTFLHNVSDSFGVSLSFNQGRAPAPGQRIHCCTADLPFQDKVFSVVLLHHVLRDGTEVELSEAVRVLARDGVLIVLGLNRLGWRYRFQKRIHRFPGLAPLKVKFELDRLNMSTQGFAGAGLLGMNRPLLMSSGLAGLGLSLADVVLFEARHIDSPEVSQLRFRDHRSGIVQSAPQSG
jgi:SAM-dependent methyltransferase